MLKGTNSPTQVRSLSPRAMIAQSQENNNNDSIKVCIRIKPHQGNYHISSQTDSNFNNQQQLNRIQTNFQLPHQRKCIQEILSDTQLVLASNKNQNTENLAAGEIYNFDYIAQENISQEDMFKKVGKYIVDQCLEGYNGSIYAYGQTGSGKTFTIQGNDEMSEQNDNARGLLPRSFEYLFERIKQMEGDQMSMNEINPPLHQASTFISQKQSKIPTFARSNTQIRQPQPNNNNKNQKAEFEIKCQFLEIYNETIIDLLDPSQTKVQIREDKDKGVWAECTEEKVTSIADIQNLINKGTRNRHIGNTNMNKQSSRSHSVFTATIIQNIMTSLSPSEKITKTSRFHIIDLAGSERIKDTGAEGMRLKEANMINKSLTTLSSVINDLAESSQQQQNQQLLNKSNIKRQGTMQNTQNQGAGRHIRYRESKLTHLLKDSLGGNSKTVIICNINPHIMALNETRSTLQFAKRAKTIKNKAVINKEEIHSADYWKNLYYQLLEQKNGALNLTIDQEQLQQNERDKDLSQIISEQKVCINEANKIIKEYSEEIKDQQEQNNELISNIKKMSEENELQRNVLLQQIFSLQQQQQNQQMNCGDYMNQAMIGSTNKSMNELELINQQLQSQNNELKIQLSLMTKQLDHQNSKSTFLQTINKVLAYLNKVEQLVQKEQFDTQIDFENNNNMEIDCGAKVQTKPISPSIKFLEEIANLKIKYEEKLEVLRKENRVLEQKVKQYLKVIGGTIANGQKFQQQQHQTIENNNENLQESNLLNSFRLLTERGGQLMNNQTLKFQDSQLKQVLLHQQQEKGLSTTTNQLKFEIEQKNQMIEEQDLLLDDYNSSLAETQQKVFCIMQEANDKDEKIQQLMDQNDSLHKEIKEQELQTSEIAKHCRELEMQVKNYEKEIEGLYSQISALNSQMQQSSELQEELKDLRIRNENLEQTNDYYTNNFLPTYQQQFQNLKNEMNQLQFENQQYKKECQDLKQSIFNSSDKNKELIVSLEVQNQQLKQSLQEKDTLITNVTQTILQSNENIDIYKQRIEQQNKFLESLQKENVNYSEQLKKKEFEIKSLQEKSFDDGCQVVALEEQFNEYMQDLEKEKEQQKQEFQKEFAAIQCQLDQLNQENEKKSNQIKDLEKRYMDTKIYCDKYKNQYEVMKNENEKMFGVVSTYYQTRKNNEQNKEEIIQKIQQQNQELKDTLKKKEEAICALNSEIKQRKEYLQKFRQEDQSKNLLMQEIAELKKNNEILEFKFNQIQSENFMIQDKLKNSQESSLNTSGLNISASSINSNLRSLNSKGFSSQNSLQQSKQLGLSKGTVSNQQKTMNEGQMQQKLQQYKEQNFQTQQKQQQNLDIKKQTSKEIQEYSQQLFKLLNIPYNQFMQKGEFSTKEQLEMNLQLIQEKLSQNYLENQENINLNDLNSYHINQYHPNKQQFNSQQLRIHPQSQLQSQHTLIHRQENTFAPNKTQKNQEREQSQNRMDTGF